MTEGEIGSGHEHTHGETFIATLIHPEPILKGCKKRKKIPVEAVGQDLARVRLENQPVLCDTCNRPYTVTSVKKGKKLPFL